MIFAELLDGTNLIVSVNCSIESTSMMMIDFTLCSKKFSSLMLMTIRNASI